MKKRSLHTRATITLHDNCWKWIEEQAKKLNLRTHGSRWAGKLNISATIEHLLLEKRGRKGWKKKGWGDKVVAPE